MKRSAFVSAAATSRAKQWIYEALSANVDLFYRCVALLELPNLLHSAYNSVENFIWPSWWKGYWVNIYSWVFSLCPQNSAQETHHSSGILSVMRTRPQKSAGVNKKPRERKGWGLEDTTPQRAEIGVQKSDWQSIGKICEQRSERCLWCIAHLMAKLWCNDYHAT